MFKRLALLSTLFATISTASANIVILGTRAIYPAEQKSINIQLNNVGKKPALVQAWLDRGDERSSPDSVSSKVPFIITPPVSRVNGNEGQTLRVVYTGEPLPQDRESVFYLNVLDIPPKPTGAEAEQNFLQMSIRSRIKFFYRPQLSIQPGDAYAKVQWQVSSNKITANNPTPYYITFANVEAMVKGKAVRVGKVDMVAPFSSLDFPIKGAQGASSVKWAVINDYGGESQGETPLR